MLSDLEKKPSVSILIPTYARTKILGEAVASALAQDYDGPLHVIVVNDCRKQFLRCADKRVTVINGVERYQSLGAKRNASMRHSSCSWVTWLDDDDLLMPWHVSRLVGAMRAETRAVFPQHIIRFEHQRWSWGDVPGGINGMLVRTDFAFSVGAFNATLDVGEDNDFRNKMLTCSARISYAPGPSYVYRVDAPVFHVSRSLTGTEVDIRRFNDSANERLRSGEEPHGTVEIIPRLDADYEGIFRSQFPNDVPVKR